MPPTLRMSWRDLLFAHWPMPADGLRSLVPAPLEVDTFDGSAWLGVVPFRMVGTTIRPIPPIPGLHAFGEVNVRTYVRYRGRPGVWFLSLDAASRLNVFGGGRFFGLPYHLTRATVESSGDAVTHRSSRLDRVAPADFDATYRPVGPVRLAPTGSLESFVTDRMCLFAMRRGRLLRTDVEHGPWPLQAAEWEPRRTTVVDALGLALPATPAHLVFSRRLDVLGRWPVPADEGE